MDWKGRRGRRRLTGLRGIMGAQQLIGVSFRSRFTIENQNPAFAEIEFRMSGLGFHWSPALPPDRRWWFGLSRPDPHRWDIGGLD
jgi:hypothetical protein